VLDYFLERRRAALRVRLAPSTAGLLGEYSQRLLVEYLQGLLGEYSQRTP
jgi:hypothetical protein